jgi:hypothetical protein
VVGSRTYRAEETEVPAPANTVDISASANDRKVRTTTGSNCVPLVEPTLPLAAARLVHEENGEKLSRN